MEQLVQIFFAGIVSGALYASLALSLVLVHRTTGVINFAQGEMAMLQYLHLPHADRGRMYLLDRFRVHRGHFLCLCRRHRAARDAALSWAQPIWWK